MSAVANALSGQSPDDIQSILAQLNALLTPTEKLPTAQEPSVSILSPSVTGSAARGGGGVNLGGASATSSTGSTLSNILGLAKGGGSVLSNLLGAGSLGSAATADQAGMVNDVNALDVTNDGTAGLVQASIDNALGTGVGDAASYGGDLGAAAAADQAAMVNDVNALNVTNDGTAAAVQASTDAATAANDGGAAGAGAGADGSALGDAGTALGALGSAYSLYNEVQNYKSGATGSDAESGAETGAGIGTMILPGIGTVIGGALGGLGGAIASAFGGGENDPETQTWNNVAKAATSNPSAITGETPSQLYQNLAGIMDAKDNTAGHSTPLELTYGREGEGSLMDAMASQVNQAVKANPSLEGDSASQMYSSVVEPWLQQTGAYVPSNAIVSSNGTQNGNEVNDLLTGLLGDWMGGSINSNSQLGINGQTIGGLANYIGLTPEELTAMQPVQAGNQGALGALKGVR